MIRTTTILAGLAVAFAVATPAQASWIFRPSQYSHDPNSGERVTQYAEKKQSHAPSDSSYVKSGFRHRRMTTRSLDGSVDRLHLVETWGKGEQIRPYGEWQRPFRAGATPYGPWGNPGGPWTTPFESWQNPYGLGQLPYGHFSGGYPYGGAYPRQAPYPAPYSSGPSRGRHVRHNGPPMRMEHGQHQGDWNQHNPPGHSGEGPPQHPGS